MNYDKIEKKDEKTLAILYRVIESGNGRLSFSEKLYRKLYCNIDITSKEEMCIYDYLSSEGYIKSNEELRKDGIMVYYQAKDLDNYLTDDGKILIKGLYKKLTSNVFILVFRLLKYIIGLCFG